MWLIAGTVPEKDFSIYAGTIGLKLIPGKESLILPDGRLLPIGRGTTALVATFLVIANFMGTPPPSVLIVGDRGSGTGSKEAYDWLNKNLATLVTESNLQGITFHYFFPDLDSHNHIWVAIESLPKRPILVADAGFMYVAKMSGYATKYDLFTPDMGELAFLADEKAPHPFYTRGFLSQENRDVPRLLERAIKYKNYPANMIIKGKTDYIICNNKLAGMISEPSIPAMECIGGTGDMVKGAASAYLSAVYPICKSAFMASVTS